MPALRTLTRSPGFTLAVVLTLALGIASTTAVFSVFNAVLLRPFPYPSPDRIVALQQADKHEATSSPTISYPDYVDLVTQSGAFTRATVSAGWFPSLSGAGDAEILNGSIVDSPFFDVFGVKPERGRFFTVQEDKPGLDDKVVISHGLWKRKFGGADVVGRPLRVDGRSLTIIGIVPATFEDPHLTYGHDADVWTTIAPKFDGDWTRSGRSRRGAACVGASPRRQQHSRSESACAGDRGAIAARVSEGQRQRRVWNRDASPGAAGGRPEGGEPGLGCVRRGAPP